MYALADRVTINPEQELYVLHHDDHVSCLGFDKALDKLLRLHYENGEPSPDLPARGTIDVVNHLEVLMDHMHNRYKTYGEKCLADLSPRLIGLEGLRVEVETMFGETERFQVSRSTGWYPIHVKLKRRDSSGGEAADIHYKSVRIV